MWNIIDIRRSNKLAISTTAIYKTGDCQSDGANRLMVAIVMPGRLSKTSSTSKGINKGTGTLAIVARIAMIWAVNNSFLCCNAMR